MVLMPFWSYVIAFLVVAAFGHHYACFVFDEWELRNVMPAERNNFRRKSRGFAMVFAVLAGLAALFLLSVWPRD